MHCRMCRASGTQTIKRLPRHTLQRCRRCTIVFLDPFPTPEATRTLYKQDTLKNATYYEANRAEDLISFKKRLRIMRGVLGPRTGRLLDYGCSTGNFMEIAHAQGYTVIGSELYKVSTAICRRKGFTINKNIAKRSFDVIHASDIIEHVHDVKAYLAELRALLKPGGAVVISTPDFDNFIARKTQVKPLEHLYYFTKATLADTLRTAGFRVRYIKNFSRKRTLRSLVHSATSEQKAVGFLVNLFRMLHLDALINPILSNLQDDLLAIATKEEV